MRRKAYIKMNNEIAGMLWETDQGYSFQYNENYIASMHPQSISLTLPIQKSTYESKVLFPFFDGLIPEGWLLDIAERNWKLNEKDRMGLLLACCKNCIGAVSIEEIE